jgi:hypothetical protein
VETCFDLAGRTSLVVAGAEPDAVRAVERQMDPFPASARAAETDAVLRLEAETGVRPLDELQRAAGDGLVTAWDGERLRVVIGGRSCSVPDPAAGESPAFRFEPGFPLGEIVRSFVKPALQLGLPAHGAAAVHSTAVVREGGAILVAGWSESGKTEVALALLEEEGSFLSDKWTVLGTDGQTSAFPMSVGIRRWVLPYLPKLRRGLPARHRAQLRAAGIARAASAPLRRAASLPGQVAERAVSLGERAALSPSELRGVYGQDDDPGRRVPLRLLVLLTTVPDGPPSAAESDPARAAARLAASAAYERRAWFSLAERARYLGHEDALSGPEATVERERAILGDALANVAVVEARTPFPADPRRVVAELAPWL